MTLVELAAALTEVRVNRVAAGMAQPRGHYHFRSIHRYETGEQDTPADVREDILVLTEGAVAPNDLHETRIGWLKGRTGNHAAPMAEPARPVTGN